MFIPKGKALHENLATSYVLIDALIDDLCEGGFSGVIELRLRDSDAHIILDRGKVIAAVERRDSGDYARAQLAELVAQSRRERGRVSVYSYAADAATTIGLRAGAQALYTGLSTEFADIERMLSKLSRERDRQWFIEIKTESGATALLHIEDDRFRLIRSGADESENSSSDMDLANNQALRELIDRCNSEGGTFDVYFRRAGEPVEVLTHQEGRERKRLAADEPQQKSARLESEQRARPAPRSADESADKLAALASELRAAANQVGTPLPPYEAAADEASRLMEAGFSYSPPPSNGPEPPAASPDASKHADESAVAQNRDAQNSGAQSSATGSRARTRAATTGDLEDPYQAETMVEVKRLMGEIARTIEEASRAVEQRDIFPMYLRAGQLKIADRYTFLDPFGAEFEYLGGEIAFIGRVRPGEFIAGLTEALSLATLSVIQSSTQPQRMRARIREDLSRLLERSGAELEQFGLDQTIVQILED